MESLMAFPDLVLIDRDNGQKTGTTSIHYDGGSDSSRRPILFERIVPKPWNPISLELPRVLSSPSGDPKRDGVFTQTLKPGQVYQVVMYQDRSSNQDVDPNVVDPASASPEQKPTASVTVVALLKDPKVSDLIVFHDQTVGGTWFRKVASTRVPTYFMLQVSKTPPFTDAQGIERFQTPLATIFGTAKLQHDQEVVPLLPGNDLFYLMRVIDMDTGNWQSVSNQFRTKQRKVTINFKVLHVLNDGAFGNTTAEFRIWVMEGDTAIKHYFFGDVENFEISDSPDENKDDQEFIQLAHICPTFILGPKDVIDETNEVGILTRGLIERDAGENEWAANYNFGNFFPNPKQNVPGAAKLRIPTGAGENVHNVQFSVNTIRDQVVDVEFEFDVTGLFSVGYT